MSDLDEFLKQAAQRRKERQQGNKPVGMPPKVPESVRKTERQMVEILEPEILEPEILETTSVLTSSIRKRTLTSSESMEHSVDLADERMQEHLKQKFQHKVGHLASTEHRVGSLSQRDVTSTLTETQVVRASANVFGVEMRDLLVDPKMLKSAFIVAEILKRPEF